jgi:hypothetical protein
LPGRSRGLRRLEELVAHGIEHDRVRDLAPRTSAIETA